MTEPDTIKLLKECNAGIKIGINGIEDVLPEVKNPDFSALLTDSRKEHEKLGSETRELLNKCHDSGKEPHPMAKSMAKMKTNVKLAFDNSDRSAASLITDGCNMGVKSLNKYLNQYNGADEKSKDIAKRLIHIEERLAEDISCFL